MPTLKKKVCKKKIEVYHDGKQSKEFLQGSLMTFFGLLHQSLYHKNIASNLKALAKASGSLYEGRTTSVSVKTLSVNLLDFVPDQVSLHMWAIVSNIEGDIFPMHICLCSSFLC